MFVMFPDGVDLEARILQLNGAVMRLVIEGFDDVVEFNLVHGHWLAEDGQPVHFHFTSEHDKPAPSVAVMQKPGTCSAGGRCLLARIASIELGRSA